MKEAQETNTYKTAEHHITIIQWNANGIDKHGPELLKRMESENLSPHIMCIQETFLKNPKTFELTGYTAIRNDRKDTPKGGLLILIKDGISYQEIQGSEKIECQIIQISTNKKGRTVQLVNIYNPPKNEMNLEEYNKIFKLKNAIIMGDFNAKSRSWGNDKENKEGLVLEKLIDEHDFVVINNGEPTYQRNEGGTSILDLTIVSNNLANKCCWNTIRDTCGSDHMPIQITLHEQVLVEDANPEKWKLHKANWELYKKLCIKNIGKINENDIEKNKEQFQSQLIEVATKCIPKSSTNKMIKVKAMPYWTDKCTRITKERNKARNILNGHKTKENKDEYKRLKGVANKTIEDSKKEYWENYCESLTDGTKLSKVWQMSRKMDGNNNKHNIPNLKVGDAVYESNKEKADILAEYFASVSHDQNYDTEFLEYKRDFEENQKDLYTDNTTTNAQNTEINEPFTIQELNEAISRTREQSSPGSDTITYEMIKELPREARIELLHMYNIIWKEGKLPKEWKHAIILPFAKPEKDPKIPKSYRPISLTSSLCKIMEQMVTKRLTWYLESNGILTAAQTGFRKGRSTNDQIVKLHEQIYKFIKNKGHTVGVFLDFEKAYDMLWRNGLLSKLKKIGINGNMFAFVKDFVANRTFQVQVGNERSERKNLDNGTPQGSVISPILFLIMINDLSEVIKNVQLSLFADDSATYKSGKNLKFIMKEIQRNIDQIQTWCQTWGFKISTEKSCTVIFTNKKQQANSMKPITINGKEIKTEQKVKFLGMIFDDRITWEEHVKYIASKCKKRLNLMRCLSGTKWGANKKCQLTIYRTLIRSILDYGSVAYDSAAQTHKDQLQTIQNTALRVCCGAFKSTAAASLQVDCGEMPLALRRKKLQLGYATKIKSDINHPNKNLLLDHWTKHYGSFKKGTELWTDRLANIIEEINVTPTEEHVSAPWEEMNISIDTELVKLRKTEQSEYHEKIKQHMDKYKDKMEIFTDAAKDRQDKVAYAILIPKMDWNTSIRIADGTSIDTAEMMAIDAAIKWAIIFNESNGPMQHKGVVIYSDSLRGVNSIKKELKMQGSPINQLEITVTWIPSHHNIEGNEKVDGLAKKALGRLKVEEINIPGKREAFAFIEQIIMEDWQKSWNDSKTGTFFREINPQVGKRITYTNKSRKKETTICRLRFGKNKLNYYMQQMGLHEDGLCKRCKTPETTTHFLLECRESGIGEIVKQSCIKDNIEFNIRNILNDERLLDTIYMNIKRNI